jgi:hypothetical protein
MLSECECLIPILIQGPADSTTTVRHESDVMGLPDVSRLEVCGSRIFCLRLSLPLLSFPARRECFSYYPFVQFIHVVDLVTGVLHVTPHDIPVECIQSEITW